MPDEEPTPLSPAGLLSFLREDLAGWVAERKGYLSIAGDPGEVLEALTDGPANFRVVLAWTGDDDQTGQCEAGIVDNSFDVWLIKARGLPLKAGTNLISGEVPFLTLLSDLRSRVRSCLFPVDVTNRQVLYKGAKQFDPELALELPTTGYKLSFELTSSIPFEEYRES